VANEAFSYVDKSGEEKFVPAQIKIIGLGYRRHPSMPLWLAKFFCVMAEIPDFKAFCEAKFEKNEDFYYVVRGGYLWIR
jgi:hypothetical protein